TDEKLLFDEVTLRFLSSFYSEYEYEVTTILSNVNEYNFIFKGNVEIKKGWKNIYTTDEEEIEKETINVNIEEGESFNILKSEILNKKTKKKPSYTTATILAAMQKYNIGTEATRTEIIKTLLKREYIIREGKKLISTKLGKEVIKNIINEVKSVEMTSNLEFMLDDVLNNKVTENEVLKNFTDHLIQNINELKNNNLEQIESETIGKCPCCDNGQIVEKKDFFGCDNYKNGCKFSISKKYAGCNITINQVKKLLKNGQTDLINFNGQYGKFKSKIIVDKENQKIKLKKK
ncbi:DNA topoisomerase, partial [Clostridium botulinum]